MKKKLNLAALLTLLLFSNFTIAKTYKIAFGSCLDQEDPQPIWNSIKKENINSFVFLGDNVYGDVPSGDLDFMDIISLKIFTKCSRIETIIKTSYTLRVNFLKFVRHPRTKLSRN